MRSADRLRFIGAEATIFMPCSAHTLFTVENPDAQVDLVNVGLRGGAVLIRNHGNLVTDEVTLSDAFVGVENSGQARLSLTARQIRSVNDAVTQPAGGPACDVGAIEPPVQDWGVFGWRR